MDQRHHPARDMDLGAASSGQVWALYGSESVGLADASSAQVAAHLEQARQNGGTEWLWLHLDAVATGVAHRIEAVSWLPEDAAETLLRPDKDMRLGVTDGIVHGTLPALQAASDGEEPEVVPWHFALRPDTLITTRRRPTPGLFALRQSIGRAGTGPAPEFPAEVIDRALLGFANELRRMIATLDLELDAVEDALLQPDLGSATRQLGGELGRARRFATVLRRAIGPLDRVIHDDDLELPAWAAEILLDRARPAVRSVMDDLLALQDRARSLQDELASRQAEETNRRLYLVSIMTTLMLPATVVTGFFGMNTGGMFLSSLPHGTALAGTVCLLFMALTWLLLKRLRLL
ncbi:CorA family divalent cation transporter [Rhizosaccharibacter radicis]|uniref:Magnesium transporter n=1 Tax=Rhizosaccharibacter radicis TaxID=2782605 RepID=A0ABT1VV12_9PROT|nr:magnesium transporter [Acetobacteraceae bacterium KSS12]